jgi:hypothetical protein
MSSNTDIPLDPSGAEVAVVVKMPFVLDVSGLTAELFGQEYDLTGDEIDVSGAVGVTNFFNGTDAGWLHYLQGEDEDNFDVYVNRDVCDLAINDISGALNILDGSDYLADQDDEYRDVLQCNEVFSQNNRWDKYHSLQDFVVSWFAYKILGHPAALAAISNDSYLRSEALEAYETGIAAMRGADSAALSVTGISGEKTVAAVEEELDNTTGGPSNGMEMPDLRFIVQQLMEQAPARFIGADRGYLLPVPWYSGDQIHIQMNMVGNTFQIATGSTTGSAAALDSRAKDGVFKNRVLSGPPALTNTIDDQSFILKLHL